MEIHGNSLKFMEMHGNAIAESSEMIRHVPWVGCHALACFASINEDLTYLTLFEYEDGDKNGSSEFVKSKS